MLDLPNMSIKSKKISSNMEDYLEAIAFIKKGEGIVRVNDIGRFLRVKNPSVNAAMAILARSGLVEHERYGTVELTAKGEKLANGVQKRHDTIFKFLSEILKIDHMIAQTDACKMEHAMSQATLEKLVEFIGQNNRMRKAGHKHG